MSKWFGLVRDCDDTSNFAAVILSDNHVVFHNYEISVNPFKTQLSHFLSHSNFQRKQRHVLRDNKFINFLRLLKWKVTTLKYHGARPLVKYTLDVAENAPTRFIDSWVRGISFKSEFLFHFRRNDNNTSITSTQARLAGHPLKTT